LAVLGTKTEKYNTKPIYELVIKYFEPMQKDFGWGSNLLYFLGAQNDVHPSYIQNLLSDTHYGTDEIVGAISYLSNLEGTTSYDSSVLKKAVSFNDSEKLISGDDSIRSIFDDKNVLIITNAATTKKYSKDIEEYIKVNKPTVISINIVNEISVDLIDYYVISHNTKFLSDSSKYKDINKSIILPQHRFSDAEMKFFNEDNVLDFGVEVTPDEFSSELTSVTIPYDITFAYLLGALINSKPLSIKAVGLDGYSHNDPRQNEMNKILALYSAQADTQEIITLTPSTYNLTKSSIYAPDK
jgi:4-hydroxy 2-oxovalerate aldolase